MLGIGTAGGGGVSVGLIAAIYVSNLPEAIGGATDLRASGWSRERVLLLWLGVALACTLSSALGFAVADSTSGEVQAGINGFAAGALLVMLVDSMIPEAREQGGRKTGLVTALGFALAAGLSLG